MPKGVTVEWDVTGSSVAGRGRYKARCWAPGCGWIAGCNSRDAAEARGRAHEAECIFLTVPAGFDLRPARRLDPSTRRQRPTAGWRGFLRDALAAGGGERWLMPKEWSPGNAASALSDRGALLIAEKGAAKRYRLTSYGVSVARGEG